jgi:hypothetical protein
MPLGTAPAAIRPRALRTWILTSLAAAATLAAAALAAPAPAHAADASYRTLTTASNPDWMRPIPDGTSLASISIPGTHETLAIHGGTWVETQENYGDAAATLRAQLDAGIRMIDIRARVNDGNTFTIHHGAAYQNANFDDVLNVLGSFLDQHPAEAVVMRLKQECTGELGSCTDAGGQRSFADIFDGYRDSNPAALKHFWQKSTDRSAWAPTPDLGTIRGKIVLAIMNGAHGSPIGNYGLAQFADWHDGSSTYIQDNYNVPNTGAIATKRDQVRRHLDTTNSGDQSKMYVNFATGASILAKPFEVSGGGGGVQGVNPFLLIYLNQGPDVHLPVHRTGMVMLDYPGGGLINKIISFN